MSVETAAWIVLAFAALPALMTGVNLRLFRRLPAAPGAPASRVSLLIPARNEEANIGPAIEAALASEGVELEVIVMDDDSTDATAAVVTALARRDRRVRLMHAPPLPPGWVGKQHACHALGRAARGSTLVFVDADVRLAPAALARIAGFLNGRDLGLVSGFPRQQTGTFFEALIMPLIHVLLLGYLPMWLMRLVRARMFATGCGQLMAVRREAYEFAGGHGAIRSSRHDGLALPRVLRGAGFDTDVFDAADIARCRMYVGAGEVWRGFSRNADEAMATPLALPIWTLLLGLGHIAPFPLLLFAAATGNHTAWAIAALSAAIILTSRIALAHRFRHSLWSAALHPVAVAVLLVMQWNALLGRYRKRPVTWRGRSYAPQQPEAALEPLAETGRSSRTRSCRLGPDDGLTFDVPADQLLHAWLAVADGRPRARRLGCDTRQRCTLHTQRTALFGFIDEIRAEVTDLGGGRSALTVDSRSRFAPVWDFGTNRRRLKSWCTELRRELAVTAQSARPSALGTR